MISHFVAAYDDVTIKRFEGDTEVDAIRPSFIYAPKQKVLYDMVQKGTQTKLPVIAVSLAGVVRNGNRQHGKN